MRAGGYTVHQSLTAEAAAVLKLALGLARGRGHAQVTPLHVAFTLLGSSSSTSCAYGLLRRACARAHPGAAAAQCRALELCFNVALKRLPSTTAGSPPPSCSSVVHHPSPTLSNALVAALKRAQASQRRGCVDLQPPPPTAQQQLQPLLTIKVELDQLIVSILDDPSVSRVMREAGFSSAAVKTSLEEDSAMLLSLGHSHSSATSSPSSSPAPSMPLPSQMWPPQFPNHPNNYAEFKSHSHQCREDDDVNAILDVMSRKTKQGGRTNPAVVADCASAAEASVAELMRRMERGGGAVPDALRGAHVLRLHLSRVHVRLMARADVDAWAADLRRTVAACTNSTTTALLIYVGDMHWAVDDGAVRGPCCYSAAQHMAAALARLLGELRAAGRACWLVAAASYTTYMRCQRRGLDATWALQPVPVPGAAGELNLGLGLGPRAAAR